MLTDAGIKEAIDSDLLALEPFESSSLQPASYDMRVGAQAYVSGDEGITDVARQGLVIIEPGEFAVVTTRETVRCGPQVAGQLGLSSALARQGLTLLSGPQIDPGFEGVLIVRVANLAPNRVTLLYESPFLTAQFFQLARPVEAPYSGRRQGQTGLSGADVQELMHSESQTVGGMVKSLQALARDVADLRGSVKELSGRMSALAWIIPLLVGFGIAVMATIFAVK